MIVNTRDFGAIDIEESEILVFIRPIYGFEHLSKFVLLSDESVGKQFVWLQSIEEENICFILADPNITIAEYHPKIASDLKKLLGEGDPTLWCVAIVPSKFTNSTINLKSPILINPKSKLAMQVVLDEDYPIRQGILSQKNVEVQ